MKWRNLDADPEWSEKLERQYEKERRKLIAAREGVSMPPSSPRN